MKSLSRVRLFDPMDCILPGFSVRGISQARVPRWVAISYSRGPSQPRDQTQVSALQADTLPSEPPGESKQEIMKGKHGIVPWPCVPWVLETVLSEFFTTAFHLLGNSANEIVDLCVFVSPWLESFKINFLKPNTRIWLPS